jgi:histidinol-phosphate aminotransferase
MAPYALAELNVPAGKRMISMAQNESIRAPSPLALEAARDAMANAYLYPDPDWTDLRKAIASVHKVPKSRILCGAGSMELIACIAHAFLGPGTELLTTRHAYAFSNTVAQYTGAHFRAVDEVIYTVDPAALLPAVRTETKIVFIANPGNPTGTVIPRSAYRTLREGLSEDILLIIDEAYGEFQDKGAPPDFSLVDRGNTIFLRTFSKAYGLAGMRVGWGVFPEAVAIQVRKLLNPNNISVTSQACATAAMHDQAYMKETCALTARLRDAFSGELARMGFPPVPSSANFVLIPFPDANAAQSADAALLREGIVMRAMGGYGLPHCLRATIINTPDMALVTDVLKRWSTHRR